MEEGNFGLWVRKTASALKRESAHRTLRMIRMKLALKGTKPENPLAQRKSVGGKFPPQTWTEVGKKREN